MSKHERTEAVLEILRSRSFCTVEELVRELHYSPATIRRDLTHLAQKGLVEKSYGGATFIGAKTFSVREHQHTDIKTRLCLAAQELIRDGDYVFVDGTTTTYFLRDVLRKKQKLSVVTTNLKLAVDLCDSGVTCYVPGGRVCDTAMLGGPIAAEALEHFSFSVAFLSPGRVNAQGGFAMPEVFSDVARTVLKNSRRKVCIFHREKLVEDVNYAFGRLGCFDAVITNAELPEQVIADFPGTAFMIVK